MATYLLGMDYGTGGAKACIVDEDANVLAYAFREYPFIHEKSGWSEHEPLNYWTVACAIIKECIQKAGIDPKEIGGIANSSALPSLVMVDKTGSPINRAYNLMDRRATREVQWLMDHVGAKRLFEVSANRLEDHPTLVNLMWERNNRPKDYARIWKALTIDGFVRYKLTGKATANFSSGAFYGVAYDVRKNRFDEKLLREIELDLGMMPAFHSCEEIVGEVTAQAAAETGLAAGTPVAAGSVDCNAGWVAGGAVDVGDIQINLGTCAVMGCLHRNPDSMVDSMINCTYTTDSRNVFATVSAATTGGQTLRYLRDEFSPVEVAMEKLVPGTNAFDYLEKEAGTVPPGCDGLLVLPYLMGERTPIWDVNARGVIFGLSLNHTKAHLVRAFMEAVAYALYDSYVVFEKSCSKINLPIVLNEGGAKNPLWRRIVTDVLNVPTVFVKSRIGAPLGDAILAGVATRVFPDFSIAKRKAEYIHRLEPDQGAHELYMKYYRLYKSLYAHVKEDFVSLAAARNR